MCLNIMRQKGFFFCWKLNRVELICIAVAICNDFAFAGVVRECPIGRAVRAYCWVFLQCFLFRCLHSREKGYQLHGSAEARTAKKAKKSRTTCLLRPAAWFRGDPLLRVTCCERYDYGCYITTSANSATPATGRLQMLLACQNQNDVPFANVTGLSKPELCDAPFATTDCACTNVESTIMDKGIL